VPNRILREGILTSDRVDALSAEAEVFYRRLMSVVDDFGRFDGRLAILKAACYPLRADKVPDARLRGWLDECVRAGLVRPYGVGGKPYLELLDFRQAVRAKQSKCPDPANADPPKGEGDASATHVRSKRVADAKHPQANAPVVEVEVGDGGVDGGEGSAGAAPPPAPKPSPKLDPDAPTTAVWDAYATAYFARYGTEPVRNKTVNGQLANLLARLGREEAPQVAAYFVRMGKKHYVERRHPVGLLLHDAEGIRTQWATGQAVTSQLSPAGQQTEQAIEEWRRNGTDGP
jgi:hypothetical protein